MANISEFVERLRESMLNVVEANLHPVRTAQSGYPELNRREALANIFLTIAEGVVAVEAATKLGPPVIRRTGEFLSLETVTFQDILKNPKSFVNKSIRGCYISDAVGQYLGTMPVGESVKDIFLFYPKNALGKLPNSAIPVVMGVMTRVDHEKYPPRLDNKFGVNEKSSVQLDPNFPHPTVDPKLEGAVFDFGSRTIHIGEINPPLKGLTIDPKTDSQLGRQDQGVLDVAENAYGILPVTSIYFSIDSES